MSSSSDEEDCVVVHPRKRYPVKRRCDYRRYVISSDDSDSSVEIMPRHKTRKLETIVIVDSSSSQSDAANPTPGPSSRPTSTERITHGSPANSTDVPKCNICFDEFEDQTVATPEHCSHYFCYTCLFEWSKTKNNCPIDRRDFNFIHCRDPRDLNRVSDILPASEEKESNSYDQDFPHEEEDYFCQICGSSDNEEILLLCDSCNCGYHTYCLDPPMALVPDDAFFCPGCRLMNEWGSDTDDTRLLRRTRQVELTSRSNAVTRSQIAPVPPAQPSPSTSRAATTTRRKPKRKRRKRRVTYKIVYKIDKTTGETVAVKKRKRKSRRKKVMKKVTVPKSVKSRLAAQLGICKPRSVPQNLPDVRVPQATSGLSHQRAQTAIPTLHLFGNANQLDLFSDDDENDTADYGDVLVRRGIRTPSQRTATRRKATIHSPSVVSSSTDLLSSILDNQTQLFSKKTKFSVDPSGRVKMQNNNVDLTNRNNVKASQRGVNSTDSNTNNVQSNNDNHSNQPSSTVALVESSSGSGEVASGSVSCAGADENAGEECSSGQSSSHDNEMDDETDEKKEDGDEESDDSEVDIYSDIETVSTSKINEDEVETNDAPDLKAVSDNEDENDSDDENDMVIDTDKAEAKEETTVTSTVEELGDEDANVAAKDRSSEEEEIQSFGVPSSSMKDNDEDDDDEDADSEDGCPNFSIYSKESITLAKNTDISLSPDEESVQQNEPNEDDEEEPSAEAESENVEAIPEPPKPVKKSFGLYSDSEDESIVKKDTIPFGDFGISDIRNMTEDISEEERSYTPCLDEKGAVRNGLDGLETELISDEERNDFDESHELKTASDGDALEINAKESELDFTRPEDYEEGEIIDKSKKAEAEPKKTKKVTPDEETVVKSTKTAKRKEKLSTSDDKGNNKENETSFKKLSKSSKDRNYRDRDNKDKDRSKSREKKTEKSSSSYNKKERRKRKEIERYDVRALISEKPRRQKDKFGRDIRRTASRSKTKSPSPARRSSSPRPRRSVTPRPTRRSVSKTKRRARSRNRRSVSRSKSPRSRSTKNKKRKHSTSREKPQKKHGKSKKDRSRSRRRSRSRKREWYRKDWTPTLSRSRSPEPGRHLSPSWTPPRNMESCTSKGTMKQHGLTVILNNDSGNRKKKERKKKSNEKRANEPARGKKRRHCDRTPPPSKEVFASGDNILVSVSFNKENETRDVTTRERRKKELLLEGSPAKKKREKRLKQKNKKDLSAVKPVAIIDLEKSPFKELTPSPKDVIVLSDSDNGESNDARGVQKSLCDSSQQDLATSPDRNNYSMGPKTPPEPQVKFTLQPKQTSLRAINNPLHEPEDLEHVEGQQSAEDSEMYKGPNTPPEPPNSPPSSPDAYDPFEPTKSRSPTPETTTLKDPSSNTQTAENSDAKTSENDSSLQNDSRKTLTPPITTDIQPADSQSSIHATPESSLSKSPERTSNQQSSSITTVPTVSKPVAQTTPFSSVPTTMITSTPLSSNSAPTRINLLNSTLLTQTALPQRIVLPVAVKSSPVKISPNKSGTIKSTPIKPMPANRKSNQSNQNSSNNDNDSSHGGCFDSPYSPGSSDYEDLFEPPVENTTKSTNKQKVKSPAKIQSTFDALFGSPKFNKSKSKPKNNNTKFSKKTAVLPTKGSTKQVGVKIDEETLKIIDDLPNSAVEMQVKDKFLKKLNRQERVVEEVKLVLKPHYNKKHINKDEYKDILRRAVPKICHNKSGEINPTKIKNLIEAYVKKIRQSKKVTSSSSINNPQKC